MAENEEISSTALILRLRRAEEEQSQYFGNFHTLDSAISNPLLDDMAAQFNAAIRSGDLTIEDITPAYVAAHIESIALANGEPHTDAARQILGEARVAELQAQAATAPAGPGGPGVAPTAGPAAPAQGIQDDAAVQAWQNRGNGRAEAALLQQNLAHGLDSYLEGRGINNPSDALRRDLMEYLTTQAEDRASPVTRDEAAGFVRINIDRDSFRENHHDLYVRLETAGAVAEAERESREAEAAAEPAGPGVAPIPGGPSPDGTGTRPNPAGPATADVDDLESMIGNSNVSDEANPGTPPAAPAAPMSPEAQARIAELQAENDALQAENDALHAQNEALQERLDELEASINERVEDRIAQETAPILAQLERLQDQINGQAPDAPEEGQDAAQAQEETASPPDAETEAPAEQQSQPEPDTEPEPAVNPQTKDAIATLVRDGWDGNNANDLPALRAARTALGIQGEIGITNAGQQDAHSQNNPAFIKREEYERFVVAVRDATANGFTPDSVEEIRNAVEELDVTLDTSGFDDVPLGELRTPEARAEVQQEALENLR